MQDNTITMQLKLSRVHAGALVQFLKKQGFSDCAKVAENCEQALRMFETIEHLRTALPQVLRGDSAQEPAVQERPVKARPVRHRLL